MTEPIVVSGTALLDLVLGAARRAGALGVADLVLTRPLVRPDTGNLRVRVAVGGLTTSGHRRVAVEAARDGVWSTYATGTLFDDPVFDAGGGFASAARWPRRSLADSLVDGGLVPVRWRGVELRPGAVRTRVEWAGRRARVWLADEQGDPVGYIDEVELAEPDLEALRATPVEHVHRIEYDEVAPTLRNTAPGRVVVDLTGRDDPMATTVEALAAAQRHAAAPELVFLIDDRLASAPVRGLVRSLRAERPEWLVRLVEVGTLTSAGATNRAAVGAALDADLPELVVSDSTVLAPRLTRATVAAGRSVLDRNGSVVITGGTGELGRLVAMHLVTSHGIQHLVLVSRRGPDAPGVRTLVTELRMAGAASVRVVAADVADKGELARALFAVNDRHPLTAVVHLAGVLDDRLVGHQDATRFTRVLAPKVLGAWHLHELTRHLPLAAFVLFSSTASVFGSAGQSNYAAANAFLDALAVARHAQGLAATSVSWGRWEQSAAGMSAHLGDQEMARLRRQGMTALTARQGRRIFDAAIASPTPHLVAAVLGMAEEPALPTPLTALSDEERWRAVVALVRQEVAVVLGERVGPRQMLSDAGVDSLMAVELRSRLSVAASVPLPTTLVQDHPTPNAIARLIMTRIVKPPTPRPAVAVLGVAAPGESAPETAWAALEHAGIVPKSLRGKRVGVYLAASDGDVATRVARLCGYHGPAVTICGSPLVAVHLARTAVLTGECDLALTGGDTIMVLATATPARRTLAVLTDSMLTGMLTGTGPGTIADLATAITERRWAAIRGPGAQVTVEPHGRRRAAPPVTGALPVVISGRDQVALRRHAARWADWLEQHPDTPLAGIARTAALHRTHFSTRASIVATGPADLIGKLRAIAGDETHPDVVERVAGRRTRLVFACPDHSGQWTGIGRALLRENQAFARKAHECERVFRPGWSIVDAMIGDDPLDLDHPEVVRLANVTTQVALAAALKDLGLTPAAASGTQAAGIIATATGAADTRDEVVELRPFRGGTAELMRILGTVHADGFPIDWTRALPQAELVDLPPYPFPAFTEHPTEPPADPAGALQWALRIMEFARTDLGKALDAVLDDGQ